MTLKESLSLHKQCRPLEEGVYYRDDVRHITHQMQEPLYVPIGLCVTMSVDVAIQNMCHSFILKEHKYN
jgi:hypothetical protein